ncbi:MAG: tetratricopeptide repeat protein [Ardenticatenaceae bacterium]|nr:tetratricopeptide repeat protein [Ardenticatenaceae bacterium]
MSKSRERYVQYWLAYCQKEQGHNMVLADEFAQIERAWQLLTGSESLVLVGDEREQVVLDFLFCLDDFLEKRGLLSANIHWIERGMESAQRLERYDLLGRLGQDLGWCYRSLGQPREALAYLQLALDIRRKFGPRVGEAATLNMMGVVWDDLGQYEQAIAYLEQALAIRRETSHREGEAITLHNLAASYFSRGDWGQAERFYVDALSLSRELGDEHTVAGVLNNLGELWLTMGKLEQAEPVLQQAMILFEQFGDVVNQSMVGNNLGILADLRREPEEAIYWFEQALHHQHQLGLDTTVTLNNLGTVYEGLGDEERALTYFQQAWQRHQAAETVSQEEADRGAVSLANMGGVYLRRGDWEKAWACYDSARQSFMRLGNKHKLAITLNNLGVVLARRQQVAEAEEMFAAALAIYAEVDDVSGAEQVRRNLAALLRRKRLGASNS